MVGSARQVIESGLIWQSCAVGASRDGTVPAVRHLSIFFAISSKFLPELMLEHGYLRRVYSPILHCCPRCPLRMEVLVWAVDCCWKLFAASLCTGAPALTSEVSG